MLVSGHRGAGKTTVVHKAIQDLQRQLRESNQPYLPLMVPLHGPDLLRKHISDVQVQKVKPTDKKTKPPAASNKDPNEKKTTQNTEQTEQLADTHDVLVNITIALFRALTNGISRAFQRYALREDQIQSEIPELAAQLKLELRALPCCESFGITREY